MTSENTPQDRSADALWESLPDRAPAAAPVDLWPGVRARIADEKVIVLPVRQSRWRIAVSFAAGLLTGLALWFLTSHGSADPIISAEEILAQNDVFESFDPIPPSSIGGIYFATLTTGEEGR